MERPNGGEAPLVNGNGAAHSDEAADCCVSGDVAGESDTCAANSATNKDAASRDTPSEQTAKRLTGLMSAESGLERADEGTELSYCRAERGERTSENSNEIVIDQKSMSEFEQSPNSSAIRVIDVDGERPQQNTGAEFEAEKANDESDAESTKIMASLAPAASQEEQPKQMEEKKRLIDEAARCNDLVKFFNHYKGKFSCSRSSPSSSSRLADVYVLLLNMLILMLVSRRAAAGLRVADKVGRFMDEFELHAAGARTKNKLK